MLTSVGSIWIYTLPTSGQHEEDRAPDRKWLHSAELGVCCMARLLCTSPFALQQRSPPGTPQKVSATAAVAADGTDGTPTQTYGTLSHSSSHTNRLPCFSQMAGARQQGANLCSLVRLTVASWF